MKKIILIIIILLLGMIENTILPDYSINGGFPSAVFVGAIAFSIINENEDAMFVGIVSGIVQDIYFFNGFGINLFLNFLLCLLATKVGKSIYINKRFIPIITAFGLSILKSFGVIIIFNLLGKAVDVRASLISTGMNAILMGIAYKFVLNTSKKHWKKEIWRLK